MLFLLLILMLIASVMILCVKKSKESIYLVSMCVSLIIEFSGILVFIAKKGGYSREILEFLFFSMEIKTRIQYLFITFDRMGYLIAIGRYLFPFFLMQMAMSYSMLPFIRHNVHIRRLTIIFPAFYLILYLPAIYRRLVEWNPALQDVLVQSSYAWILIYVALAIGLLIHEYLAISMRFCKRQFGQIVVCLIALSGLYILYCGQDPGQVYRFYSYGYAWNKGIGYLQYAPTISGYFMIVIVNVICAIMGFVALLGYTQGNFESNREDVVMERKFDMAKVGVSVFVHGMKNQLLSNRVIYKRIFQTYEEGEVDIDKIKGYTKQLQEMNETLISRMDELYRSVKANAIHMVPVHLEEIAEESIKRFHSKYPEEEIKVKLASNAVILADKIQFCEALYNLLTNAREAVEESGKAEGEITFLSHDERLYTVIEIRDNGTGISKSHIKKIFDPFYSSKNSNHNWGMGLHYVRAIVRGHLGSIRVESREGIGSSFFIMLPKYTVD